MKKTRTYKVNFWCAVACTILTLLWVISILPFAWCKGTWNLGWFLSILAAVLAVANWAAWRRKKSVWTLIGDLWAKIRKPASDEAEAEAEPVRPKKPAQNESMTKKNLVWTWIDDSWQVDKDHSKEPVPSGKKYDAETNTFVDVKASAAKPSSSGRPAKPVLPKSMKDNGLVWTWDGDSWVPEEDHSCEPVPTGKIYDKETNTFVDLGDVFTPTQITFIKQLIAAEVKKASPKKS